MKILPPSLILVAFALVSCQKKVPEQPTKRDWVSAVDISQFPEISSSQPVFKDLQGSPKNFLDILQENGVNTVRLRLWVNPTGTHSGFLEVKNFAQTLKSRGFKIWLSLHYSDTWADPAHQVTPAAWQGLPMNALLDSVLGYTQKVVREIDPDYVQIGNEINTGFLHPLGSISNQNNFLDLLRAGCLAVRQSSNRCQIIVHHAGIQNASWFFQQINTVDYDIIGLSFYPLWHGKSLTELRTKIQELSSAHHQRILVAETAYPFTLDWNDWTNNLVGLSNQLILPDYPASKDGQKNFVRDLQGAVLADPKGLGFCYWGAELIAWKGPQSTTASVWENQALFDFDNRAVPALTEFGLD